MYRITSNPNIGCFYLKRRYLFPYGNSAPTDLTGGCEIKKDVDFLLLACGDIRNILFTLKSLVELKIKPKTVNFHVNDIEDVILARNLVLLAILDKIDPEEGEDMDFLWSVWYDMAISKVSLQKVRHIIEELLQHGHPRVKLMTQECDNEIKNVFKYWLEGNVSLQYIKHKRNEEFEELLERAKEKEQNIISCVLYSESQYRSWKQEVAHFVETGSTHRGEHTHMFDDLVANPTLICPHVDGWRVHYGGTPFHSYNLHRLTEEQSLFENCLSQLKRMAKAWKKCNGTKSICLTLSFWLCDCLTLCNHTLPSDVKFDFIHTSNIQDHVGLLNLLAACSGRLKTSGVLTTDTMRWSEQFSSMEDYLNASIGIPPSYFPTVFGLHLAEDFTMGTSEPMSVFNYLGSKNVSIRWLGAVKAVERIDIYDSPDLLQVFRGLVQSCMTCYTPVSTTSYTEVKTPASLVHIVRTMKDNIIGGAKTLHDIIVDAQPRLQTLHGQVFYPHENCFKVTWLAYSKELGCDMLRGKMCSDQKEQEVLIFEIQAQEPQNTAVGKGVWHRGQIYWNYMDILSMSSSEPWYILTSIDYDMTGKVTFLLSSDVWNSLDNSASLSIFSTCYDGSLICGSMNIMNDSRVQIIDRMVISSKPVAVREERKCLAVKEYADRYELHIKPQESLNQSPNLKVDLGLDPTEVLVKGERFLSTYRFLCPLLDVSYKLSPPNNILQITAKKDLSVLTGPLILKYRRLDIQRYPIERKSTEKFRRILVSNDIYQESTMIDHNDPCRNISSHVRSMLIDAMKIPPDPLSVNDTFHGFFGAVFIAVSNRNPDHPFGHDADDIIICFDKCHIIDEKITVNLLWIDFEKVNRYIKEGKLTRMEVDGYFFMLGLPSGDPVEVTKEEALLLRKWLILNTMKSKQKQKDQKYQWRFNSFLQPLYAVRGVADPGQAMKFAGLSNNEVGGGSSPATDQLRASEKVCSCCSRRCPDLKSCTGCQTAFYCGKECQKKDWPKHKQSCTRHTKQLSLVKGNMETPKKVCSSCSRQAPDLKACTKCWSAFYCGKDCQTRDWPNHKQSCESSTCDTQPNIENVATRSDKICSSCSKHTLVLKACARCRSAFYCGKECQTRDWPNHKHSSAYYPINVTSPCGMKGIDDPCPVKIEVFIGTWSYDLMVDTEKN